MKTGLGLAFLMLAIPPLPAADLEVHVTGIRTTAGNIQVAVADSGDAWEGRARPVAATRVAASDQELVLHFSLPAGNYAVQVMHDANDNDKLDTNFMGIPVEGYGFSNNPTGLRKATFDEARFSLDAKPLVITIRLR